MGSQNNQFNHYGGLYGQPPGPQQQQAPGPAQQQQQQQQGMVCCRGHSVWVGWHGSIKETYLSGITLLGRHLDMVRCLDVVEDTFKRYMGVEQFGKH